MKRFFVFLLILLLVIAVPLVMQYVRHDVQMAFVCPESALVSGEGGAEQLADSVLCFYTDRTFTQYVRSGGQYEEYAQGSYTAAFDWDTFAITERTPHTTELQFRKERGADGAMRETARTELYNPDLTRDTAVAGAAFRMEETAGSLESRPVRADGDGCAWVLSEDGEQVTVLSAPLADRKDTMVVPPAVGDRKVTALCAAFIPEGVTDVYLPSGAELTDPGRLARGLNVFVYKDYGMISSDTYLLFPFAGMQPGEYAIADAVRYEADGSSGKMVREFCEYPAELNGARVHNCLNGKEYYRLYSGGDNGTFIYYKLSDTEIGICSVLDHTSEVLRIPDEIDGMKVVALRSVTYSDRVVYTYGAKKIILPSGLRELGNFAIHTKWDTELDLPEGLTSIGSHAVKSLLTKSIRIPSSVTSIGVNALEISMASFTVPPAVTTLPIGAFSFSQFKKIVLPDGLEIIPARMCAGCDKLTEIRIPGTVKEIRTNAFSNCSKLESAAIPESTEVIGAGAFSGCKKLARVTIPAGVREIADDAFDGCYSKLTITAPEGSYALQWAQDKGLRVKKSK